MKPATSPSQKCSNQTISRWGWTQLKKSVLCKNKFTETKSKLVSNCWTLLIWAELKSQALKELFLTHNPNLLVMTQWFWVSFHLKDRGRPLKLVHKGAQGNQQRHQDNKETPGAVELKSEIAEKLQGTSNQKLNRPPIADQEIDPLPAERSQSSKA